MRKGSSLTSAGCCPDWCRRTRGTENRQEKLTGDNLLPMHSLSTLWAQRRPLVSTIISAFCTLMLQPCPALPEIQSISRLFLIFYSIRWFFSVRDLASVSAIYYFKILLYRHHWQQNLPYYDFDADQLGRSHLTAFLGPDQSIRKLPLSTLWRKKTKERKWRKKVSILQKKIIKS